MIIYRDYQAMVSPLRSLGIEEEGVYNQQHMAYDSILPERPSGMEQLIWTLPHENFHEN